MGSFKAEDFDVLEFLSPDEHRERLVKRIADTLSRCIRPLQRAAREEDEQHLQETQETTSNQIQQWADLIYSSMNNKRRAYHDVTHAFPVSSEMKLPNDDQHEQDAIPILSALFHDVVYLTIDKQLSPQQAELLKDEVEIIQDRDQQVPPTNASTTPESSTTIRYKIPYKDPLVRMAMSIFPSGEHQPPPPNEANEYLSALITVKCLGKTLSNKQLCHLIACIEASIPFRGPLPVVGDSTTINDSTTPAMARLFERLTKTNQTFCVGMAQDELVKAVQGAAYFANNDLMSFRSEDVLLFRYSSWSLIYEWTPALLENTRFQDILGGIHHLYKGYQKIPVDLIFQSFQGVPNVQTIEEMKQAALANLTVVGKYATVRLLAALLVDDVLSVALGSDDHGDNTYETILDSECEGGAVTFWKNVEEQFSTKETNHIGTPTLKEDKDTSEALQRCFQTQLPWIARRRWDAKNTRLSNALYVEMDWDNIVQCIEMADTAQDQPIDLPKGSILKRVPSKVLRELGRVMSESLPSDYQRSIHKVTSVSSSG